MEFRYLTLWYCQDAMAEVTATEDDYIDGDRVTRMEVYAVLSMDL